MLIGDSVLMSQYLALAQELQAAPAEAGLSTFAPCTDPAYSNMWPTQPAVMNLATVAHEYLLTCGAAGCAFGRLGCLHFYARTCANTGALGAYCHEECAPADWQQLVATVQAAVSQPDGFAVSFHWAPSHLDSQKVLEGGTFAFQGCAKLRCEPGDAGCAAGNHWLVEA